jgi:hypothetical protein
MGGRFSIPFDHLASEVQAQAKSNIRVVSDQFALAQHPMRGKTLGDVAAVRESCAVSRAKTKRLRTAIALAKPTLVPLCKFL